MVEASDVNVQINNKSVCIYKNTLKNEGNDLNSLISNLKSMQQRVNEILTKLVQADQSSNQGANVILCYIIEYLFVWSLLYLNRDLFSEGNSADGDDSGEDNSDDEDENLGAKKCKYKWNFFYNVPFCIFE